MTNDVPSPVSIFGNSCIDSSKLCNRAAVWSGELLSLKIVSSKTIISRGGGEKWLCWLNEKQYSQVHKSLHRVPLIFRRQKHEEWDPRWLHHEHIQLYVCFSFWKTLIIMFLLQFYAMKEVRKWHDVLLLQWERKKKRQRVPLQLSIHSLLKKSDN